ncbi:MAG: Gfo/Idh/MocA family oxidoreductase [Kiritimatiellae bacterium]|nr:Gfo/Idh/MocA family oxidoreductase [Kiritimatiellia bacterium]
MASKKKSVKRVAIVGFGFMGRMHYGNWKKMKGVKVVAVCDRDKTQFTAPVTAGNIAGADAVTDFGDIELYDDFDQMLREARPDVISLTLPTPLHVPLTAKALQAGVSVLCEKPMALNAADCGKMIAASKKARKGAKLMVAHCLRFWPSYVYLKKLVESEKYGKVVAASFRRFSAPPGWQKGTDWFADEDKSGGVALDLHVHDTDMVNYLFGMPKAVTSSAAFGKHGEMQYISTLYDVGGAAVTAEGSWVMTSTLGFEASYFVTFEKAVVILDGRRERPLCVYPSKGAAFEPKLPTGEGYEYEIEWFLDVLNGKKVEKVITPEQSRDSVKIVDAERRSAKSGRKVVIR